MDHFKPISKWVIFCFFAICFILYHLTGYLGHYGFDDLHYAELASNLLNGQADWSDHYFYRWVIVGLTAFSYAIFGVNDFGSAFPGLLISIATLYLIFLVLKDFNWKVITLGLALFTFNNWTIFYADKLMPDIYVAFFIFAAFVLYFKMNKEGKKQLKYPLLFSLALVGAFLSKGTMILALPLFLILLLSDLVQKKNHRFWLLSFGSGILFMAVYFSVIQIVTGDVFMRFKAIGNGNYLNFCSYHTQPLTILIKRVTYELFHILSMQGMLLGVIFIIPVLLFLKPKHYFTQKEPLVLFSMASIVLLLLGNFMSISAKAYNPMCTDPRHYLFMIPFFAVAAPLAFERFGKKNLYLVGFIGFIILSGIVVKYFGDSGMLKVYMAYILIMALFFVLNRKLSIVGVVAFLLFALIPILKPYEAIQYAKKVNYQGQKEFSKVHILQSDADVIVADEVSKRFLNYWNGFEKEGMSFISYDEAEEKGIKPGSKAYLLKNDHTLYLCGSRGADLSFFVQKPGLVYDTVAVASHLNMCLYEASTWEKPELIFSDLNDMESPKNNWSYDEWAIDVIHAYEGKQSNRCGEFSNTFSLDLTTLDSISHEVLVLQADVYSYVPDETTAAIVVSIDDEEGTIFWEAFSIFPSIKSFGAWWPVQVSKMLPKDKLEKGKLLKVYVWNENKEVLYLDNFEVKISGL